MIQSTTNDDASNDDEDPRRDDIFYHYFLWRLGLISDEVDWPSNYSPSLAATEGMDDNVIGGVWRTRDALTSILGNDSTAVLSESGLTKMEMKLLAAEEERDGASAAATTIDGKNYSTLVPVASIVASFLGGGGCDDSGSIRDTYLQSSMRDKRPLDIEHVGRAFDAAATAVTRGNERASQAASWGLSKDEAEKIAAIVDDQGDAVEGKDGGGECYDPPLFVAMESIRTSRITSLDEASGIGGSKSVIPPFLKKNSTIPWFHVPVVASKSSSPVPPASMTLMEVVSAGSKVDKVKMEMNDEPVKKRTKLEHGKEKKAKKSSDATPSSNDKSKVVKSTSTKKKTTTPSSSSKHSSSMNPTVKPKKLAGILGKSPSFTDDAPSTIKTNPTASRAIISAAAAGVFQELNPNLDAGNAEGEIAKIAGDTNKEVGTPTKSPKKSEKVNMDEVVAEAKRLGDRVSDHARGAARRGDQRREFRMDGALSRVDVGVGGGPCNGQDGKGGKWPLTLQDGGEKRDRKAKDSMRPVAPAHALPLVVPNPFITTANPGFDAVNKRTGLTDLMFAGLDVQGHAFGPMTAPWKKDGLGDAEWTESCLPRLLDVLSKGAGHAIVHDMQWDDRSFRIASLLQNLAASGASGQQQPPSSSSSSTRRHPNYGPHLIVTSSGEDFDQFAKVLGQLGHGLVNAVVRKGDAPSFPNDPDDVSLRVLPYRGSKAQRRQLRKHFGSLCPSSESQYAFLAGLPDSPFHVILTTYSVLMEDFAHFCQIPFQAVVLDDGMSWLGCAHSDPQGKIGKVWNTGLWSTSDGGSGRAGIAADGGKSATPWDFSKDVVGFDASDGKKASGDKSISKKSSDDKSRSKAGSSTGEKTSKGKSPIIGLTARHRILLASDMHAQYRGQVYKAPVFGLLSFLAPQFAEAIRDDWERSRVSSCTKSMAYIRTMIARLVVVYSGDSIARSVNDLVTLSTKSLDGELPLRSSSSTQEDEGIDALIKSQKIVHSRKHAAAWFQPSSAIREEIGTISLDPIVTAVKKANSAVGFVCEEVVTASSLSVSGASGSVVGHQAYRAAARCGRCFSSEQSLKQHITSAHAPPGTWLCRICGGDCGTSLARKDHERTCGVERDVSIKSSLASNAPAIGQGAKRGRKRKEIKSIPGSEAPLDDVVVGDAAGDEGLKVPSGSMSSVPALSVIDIKKLPPHIKPLLRDPNWTSRAGGNSKRYVYAYRGVCRQQRKGHDRWQAQMSFNGTNYYLGTYDSEWDAAAVYAWAHLILYGEEATRKCQIEGEEAAAAFAQQQKDIAEGKISPPSSKPAQKKKRGAHKKKLQQKVEMGGGSAMIENPTADFTSSETKGNVMDVESSTSSVHVKKKRPASLGEWATLKTDCATMLSSGTKGTSKATILATRKDVADMSEAQLLHNISGHNSSASESFLRSIDQAPNRRLRLLPACVPLAHFAPSMSPRSNGMLIGLLASDFGWQIEKFIQACQGIISAENAHSTLSKLTLEFGGKGTNRSFRTLLVSSSCTLGRASKTGSLGMPVDNLDCNIGGPEYSCSEMAAKIRYLPSKYGNFQFMACNDDDIVTLNGQRISASIGPLPLRDRDVCSVGARVFVFIEEI